MDEWADGELVIDVSTSNPAELFQMAQEERLENRQVAIKLYEMALEAYDKELSMGNDATLLYEKAMCLKQCGRFIGFAEYLAMSIRILKQLKMQDYVQHGINVSYQIHITEFIRISVILKAIAKNQQHVSTFDEAFYHLLLTHLAKYNELSNEQVHDIIAMSVENLDLIPKDCIKRLDIITTTQDILTHNQTKWTDAFEYQRLFTTLSYYTAELLGDSEVRKKTLIIAVIEQLMKLLRLPEEFLLLDTIPEPTHPELLEMMGQAYLMLCNTEKDDENAMEAFDKGLIILEAVLAMNPDNTGLQEQLECLDSGMKCFDKYCTCKHLYSTATTPSNMTVILKPTALKNLLASVTNDKVIGTLLLSGEGSIVSFAGQPSDATQLCTIGGNVWTCYNKISQGMTGFKADDLDDPLCIQIKCKNGLVYVYKIGSFMLCMFSNDHVNSYAMRDKAVALLEHLKGPLEHLSK